MISKKRKPFKGVHGNSKRRPVDVSWKSLWHRCSNGAKARDIDFQLTMEQTKIILAAPCAYCGTEPSLKFNAYVTNKGTSRTSNTERCHQGWIKHGTIDRVDSLKPYVIGNIVPACFSCNTAKGTMSCDEFYNWLGKISSKWAQSNSSAFQIHIANIQRSIFQSVTS